jgi:hypothetical protein
MVKVIRYIIWSKNKYTGKETTTGYEYGFQANAEGVARELDEYFPSYSHRVELVEKDK